MLFGTIVDFLGRRHYSAESEKVMSTEKTYLIEHRVCINDLNLKQFKTELKGNYEYHTAQPVWIKVRLLLFWIFWASLVGVIVLSVLIYFCLVPSICSSRHLHQVDERFVS